MENMPGPDPNNQDDKRLRRIIYAGTAIVFAALTAHFIHDERSAEHHQVVTNTPRQTDK